MIFLILSIVLVVTLVVVAVGRPVYRLVSVVALSLVVAYAFFDLTQILERQFQRRIKATTIEPMSHILMALSSDCRQEDYDLLQLKLTTLQERWLQYENGAPAPKTFMNEVVNLRSNGSFPAENPNSSLAKDASRFLGALIENGYMSDLLAGNRFSVRTLGLISSPIPEYPFQITLAVSVHSRKDGVYHVLAVKASRDAPWRLQRAWKADKKGGVVTDLDLPSDQFEFQANQRMRKEEEVGSGL